MKLDPIRIRVDAHVERFALVAAVLATFFGWMLVKPAPPVVVHTSIYEGAIERPVRVERPLVHSWVMVKTRGARSCRELIAVEASRILTRCTVGVFEMADGSVWELNLKRDRPVLKQKRGPSRAEG